MKRMILCLAVMALLAACQPGASPTVAAPAPTAWPTSTSVPPVDLTPAQIVAVGKLSDSLHLPLDQIALVSTTAVDWPDTCLGVVHVDKGCVAAVTPGFRIVLEANRVRYEYHVNGKDLKQITGANQALIWRRAGAAGACQALEVYVTGEVFASACGSPPFPMTTLTLEEFQQVATWVRALGPVTATAPAGADGFTTALSFMGAGVEPSSEAERRALLNFAQMLYDKNKPCC
jgi:hypothetical protein